MPNTNMVDERVVEMRIDNEKFEAGAKKTLRILESLDAGLNKIGSQNADGFDDIGKSLDKVTDRFSAMGIVGDQIMRNLTNKAMELVGQIKNISTSLTTQQVGAGWDKYAEKVQAVQTIMASTNNMVGEGLTWANQEEQIKGVNEQLERLTWFADETSYSFTDMVNNVGKFTAAGRELEESVTAMQGISAWAAISGGRPAEASRAMYNLSQALGLGAVTAIDWKSIELANMATYEFKQQAIDTAVELGKLKKVGEGVWETLGGNEVTIEKFRDTLTFGRGDSKEQWFDSDVLLSVLNRYGDFAQLVQEVQNTFGYDSATYVLSDLKLYEDAMNGDSKAADKLKINIDALGVSMDELAEYFDVMLAPENDLGRRAFQAAQEAKTFQEAIEATKDAVSTKWMDIFEIIFGNYLEAKELWTKLSETLWTLFAGPVDRLKGYLNRGLNEIKAVVQTGTDGVTQVTSGMSGAAASTKGFEAKLAKAGKTMEDFNKAIYAVADRQTLDIIENFNSVDDALKNGAISADLMRKALVQLMGDTAGKKLSLSTVLAKNNKGIDDFRSALAAVVSPHAVEAMTEHFGGLEEAIYAGAISAEVLQKVLQSMGIEGEEVATEVEQAATGAVMSLDEMREVALGILRGDYGNGEERRQLLEEMGLDYELMQAMAGDLKNMGYDMSDDQLLAALEEYYQYNELGERLGFSSFIDYLNAIGTESEYAGDEFSELEDMIANTDRVLEEIYGGGVFGEDGELLSGGELLRKGLMNLMTLVTDLSEAFSKAFLKIFYGVEDADEVVDTIGDKFFTLAANFYNFTERIQITDKIDKVTNVLAALMTPIKLLKSLLDIVFRIAGAGLRVVFSLLGSILPFIGEVVSLITMGINMLMDRFSNSGIPKKIQSFGNTVITYIITPFEKLSYVLRTLVKFFKQGFQSDGIKGAFQKVSEGMDQLFEKHPTFLKVFHAMEKVAGYVGKALGIVADALMIVGGIVGGAFFGVYTAIAWVFGEVKKGIGFIADLINNSETLDGILTRLGSRFHNFAEDVKTAFSMIRQGYSENGVSGVFTAISTIFEKAITKIFPSAEGFTEAIHNFGESIRTFFSNIWSQISGFKITNEEVEKKFQSVSNIFSNIITGIFGTEDQRAEIKTEVEGFITSVWEGFIAGLNKIKLSDVIGALRLGVLASVAGEIMSAISVFKQIERSFKDIPETFQWVLEDLGLAFKSLAVGFQANVILKIAIAIGAIAGAILMLSFVPEDKLMRAFSIVAILMLILTLIAKYTSKMKVLESGLGGINIQNFQVIPEIAGILVGLGVLIGSIAGAVALFAFMNKKYNGSIWESITMWAAIIGGLVISIGILFDVLRKFTPAQLTFIGRVLTRMATAMLIVAFAIQMLAIPIIALTATQYLGVGKFRRAVAVVGLIFGILAVLTGVFVSHLSKIRDSSSSMIGNSAEQLRQIGNTLIKAAGAMLIVAFAIQMFVAPIIALTAVQFLGAGKFMRAIVAVIGIVAVLSILVGVFVSELSRIPGTAQLRQIGNTLLKAAASMAILAFALQLLMVPILAIAVGNFLSEKAMTTAIGQVTKLMVILGLIFAGLAWVLTRNNLNPRQISSIGTVLLSISGAIAIFSAALLLLAPAIVILAAAGMLFAAFLAAMPDKSFEKFQKGLERLGNVSDAISKFGAALMILGIGAVLAGAGIGTFALGAALLVAALAALVLVFPKFIDSLIQLNELSGTDILKNIGKIAIIIVGLAVAVGIVALSFSRLFNLFTGNKVSRITTTLGSFMEKLATNLRTSGTNMFKKIGAFLRDENNKQIILTALNGLIVTVGLYLLGVIPTLTDTLFQAIVQLVDSLAESIVNNKDAFIDSLTKMVKALLDVVTELIGSLFSADFINSLNLGEKLLGITGLLLLISKVTKGIDILSPFKKLADGIGGKTGLIARLKDAKAGIELLIDSAGGLSVVLPVVAALAAALAFANHEINAQQDILKERAFDGMEESLEGYDTAIEDTKSRIAELQEQAKNGWDTEMSNEELMALQNLLNTLEKERAELAEQQMTVTETTESMNDFASGIRDAADAMAFLKTVDLSEYDQTMDSIKRMDNGHLVEFARSVEQDLGQAWTNTASVIEESTNKITEVTSDGGALDAAREKLKGLKEDLTNGSFNTGMFGDMFSNIFDFVDLDTAGEGEIKSLTDTLSMLAENIPGGIGESIKSRIGDVSGALSTLSDDAAETFATENGIASPAQRYVDLAENIPAGIGIGIDQNYYQAVNPLYLLVDEMMNVFTNVRENFVAAGTQVVAGIIDGIDLTMEYAYQAGQNLATSVENGFTETLKIESPSRVFANLARYIPLGIEQGISQQTDSAVSSVVVLGDALIEAIMQSMAMVSTVADDEFDISPRITPVVDLDNINAAAGEMSSAFGGNYNMSAQMSSAISRRMDDVERIASNMNTSQTINNGDSYTFNIYTTEGQDPNEIADAVMLKMQSRAVRRTAAFG